MTNLWLSNQPRTFWQCQPDPSDEVWQDAIRNAILTLGLQFADPDIGTVLEQTLGEGRFGPDHWTLSPMKRGYYMVKALIPRPITRLMRRLYNRQIETGDEWPIENRYVNFIWEVMRQLLLQNEVKEMTINPLWPHKNRFAFVLTHDIETSTGQEFVKSVADLEESLGFRSSFNFVPERYPLDFALMEDLRQRGFEVGVHGLKHNGRLFESKASFMRNAKKINQYLQDWNATGFRAELTHRQPEWMQALNIEYDLSFFDTDPFEPIPGGTMSIWPFFIGHFVELPYTLVQDYTLTSILGESSPHIWLEKVDFIEKYHGMALINTHPDYLKQPSCWEVYDSFLKEMKKRNRYWHALPVEVARWWKKRTQTQFQIDMPGVDTCRVLRKGEEILFNF